MVKVNDIRFVEDSVSQLREENEELKRAVNSLENKLDRISEGFDVLMNSYARQDEAVWGFIDSKVDKRFSENVNKYKEEEK